MATTHGLVPRPYRGIEAAAPEGIVPGQMVGELPEESVVVFLIGMRFNRLRKVRSWWPAFIGMPRMLAELDQLPDSGLLTARSYWSGRNLLTVQYWRSLEDLGRYARDPSLRHQRAWSAYNRRAAASGDVGIWHESYLVSAANIESLYSNMPPSGLGAAIGVVPRVAARRTTAQDRLGQQAPEYVAAG